MEVSKSCVGVIEVYSGYMGVYSGRMKWSVRWNIKWKLRVQGLGLNLEAQIFPTQIPNVL